MSVWRLLLLSLLAVFLVGLSLVLNTRGEQQMVATDYWLAELASQLEGLQRIDVYSGADSPSVSLVNWDSSWRVEQLDNYPADVSRLAALTQQLSLARLLEPRTADPERHSRLQVDDPRGADAQGVLLAMTFESGPAEELVLGQRSEFGTVVRRLSEDQAWLVDQRLSVASEPMDWVDTLILNLPATDITQVRFAADDESYHLQRDDSRQWQLWPLPEGREALEQTSLARVAEAVSGLRARNIALLQQGDQAPEVLAEVVFLFSDGAEIAIQRLYVGDTDWVSIVVTPSEADSRLTDWQQLSERISPWRYQLPGHRMGAIFRAREALLREPAGD